MLSTVGLAMTFPLHSSPKTTQKRSILLGPSEMSINDRTSRPTSASDGRRYHKASQPFQDAAQATPRSHCPDSDYWSRHVPGQSNVVVGGPSSETQPSESRTSSTTPGEQFVALHGDIESTRPASGRLNIDSLVNVPSEPSRSNRYDDSEVSCTESTSPEIDAANILLQIQRSPPIDHSILGGERHVELTAPPLSSCLAAPVSILPTTVDTNKKRQKKTKSSSATRSSTRNISDGSNTIAPKTRQRRASTMQRSNTTASNTKKRRASRMQCSAETSPTVSKRIKKLSTEAQVGKEWCNKIKRMDAASLPFFCPPRDQFRGAIPNASTSEKYVPARGAAHEVNPNHPTLSSNEQRFVAAFGGRFTEEQYIDCKKRIFVCHRWRTEEDGLTHNIESSQQVCRVDVKVATTIHKWFDSMHMFHNRWETADKSSRPPYMGRLQRATLGRNGRELPTKVLNVLEDL